jgi:hypothetical protein
LFGKVDLAPAALVRLASERPGIPNRTYVPKLVRLLNERIV